MASLDDHTSNEHQQTFIDTATSSFNTEPYDWQYKLGGKTIEAVASNNDSELHYSAVNSVKEHVQNGCFTF